MFRHLKHLTIALACFVVPAGTAWAVEITGDVRIDGYVKVTKSTPEGRPARMETSIVTFRSKTNPGLEVALVGVIHVGEARYYKNLQARMESYDAVLYEWIGPRNSRPIAGVYNDLAALLSLESQTSIIKYDRKHYVHADMTDEDFMRALDRLDRRTPFTGKSGGGEFGLTLRKLGPTKARWEIARQLAEDRAILTHPVIIVQRNDVTMNILDREIKNGKRKIAIFYGAAHMPDFERQMNDRFGLTPTHTEWFKAWDMTEE